MKKNFFKGALFLILAVSLKNPAGAEAAESPDFRSLFTQRFFNSTDREVLSRMSLEEKIGQVLIFGFKGQALNEDFQDWLSTGKLGNLKIFLRNVESKAQIKELVQHASGLVSRSKAGIPSFIATDMEGGTVNHVRYPGIHLAPAAGLVGATGDVESARSSSRLIAAVLTDIGINMNFAPSADVLTEPRNRVVGTRSYSSDQRVVADMVKAFVEEQERAGILAIVKHFPGHGMSDFDSHLISARVAMDERELNRVHLYPYRSLMREGRLGGLMTAHIVYSGLDRDFPATFSSRIINGFLREGMKYEGIVVTDELEMEGAMRFAGDILKAFILAFNAGNDLILVGHTEEKQRKLIEELPALFRDGTLSEDELDEKVLRILKVKRRYLSVFYGGPDYDKANGKDREKELSRIVQQNRTTAENGIVLLSSRLADSLPEYFQDALAKGLRGVIIAPTKGFAELARRYLPGWDVIQVDYFPEKEKNALNIAEHRASLREYDAALLGLANERQMEWARICSEEKLPFGILSIDNPFFALKFESDALFIAACFGPNSPATEALFRSVFETGRFNGRFPYRLDGD